MALLIGRLIVAHSPRYEARLEAVWRDLVASVEGIYAEWNTARPAPRGKALAAVTRTLREPSRLRRLPLVCQGS
jgi:hypothetical protein